ncbi:DNA-binding response regulator [Planomonospora parontospora subsp. parontospora]|uniref:DNA-binding response regulator n=2 Tax=Planomonospora parontospora TaxID=58119 RepID=A0AA37BJI7_9ACTN|nr:response regulator transcription factor [Planomonospora parontospora]GGK80172.1 DNA-binding response regulator [Planomonospora parontospora]GII11304.1 DNA-binding response regulator [Planomonospora parontospora subsp. parontospora]
MTTPATLRVVLAEDHYLVREGTRRLLESTGEISVVAAVGTAGELLDAARRLRPDVVVTDIRMPSPADPVRPGMEGVDAAHRIRAAARDLGVIGVVVLSQFSDAVFALDLFRDGTEGRAYLLKDRVGDIDELLGAIRSVAAGGSVIDPKVVEGLLAKRGVRGGPPPTDLTPRELDVLREMAHGLSNGGIARTLHLSVSAIEKHVNSIFMKLALENSPDTHRRVAAVIAYLGSG